MGVIFLKTHENHSKIFLEMPIVLVGIVQDRSVSMSMHGKRMLETVTNVRNEKRASTLFILFSYQKPNIVLFDGEGTHCAEEEASCDQEIDKLSPLLMKYLHHSQSTNSNLCQKKQNSFQLWHVRVNLPLADI